MKSTRFLFVFLSFVLSCLSCFGTWQAREQLFIDGEEHSIESHPLHEYLWINKKWDAIPESFNSACWRGYLGTWRLVEDKLYLVDLISANDEPINAEDIFGEGKTYPIFAEWFSGYLAYPEGDLIYYDRDSYREYHESIRFMRIDSGHLVKTQSVGQLDLFFKEFLYSGSVDPFYNASSTIQFIDMDLESVLNQIHQLVMTPLYESEYSSEEEIAKIKSIPYSIDINGSFENVDIAYEMEYNKNGIPLLLQTVLDSVGATGEFKSVDQGVILEVRPKSQIKH